jgi:hypothetical protein
MSLVDFSGRWVYENRVVRGIYRQRRDEVTRMWRKLHNEELHDFILRRVKLE